MNSATTATTAFDSGRMMLVSTSQSLAPSILALSINSDGMPMKNWRKITRLNALTSTGRMSAA